MASGSQVCSGNWPDFEQTAAVRQMAAMSRTRWLMPPSAASALMSTMLKVPAPKNRMITPMIRPTSPTRLVRKALRAASELGFSSHQCPMSTNEQSPTSSQRGEQHQGVLGDDQGEHRRREQGQEGEVVGEAPVALQVLGAVDVDQQRHQADGDEHDHRQAVDHGPDGELVAAELEPGDGLHDRLDGVMALFGGPGREAQGLLAPLAAPAGVDVLDPGHPGAGGEHEGGADRQDARSRSRRTGAACPRPG